MCFDYSLLIRASPILGRLSRLESVRGRREPINDGEKIVLMMAKALSLDIGLSMIGLNMLDVDAYFSRLGRHSRSQILVQIINFLDFPSNEEE